ncbi:MAG: 50S ribosomal protein L4 [Gammaproteobacteria bacterium]|nr:50S ribosomal protein L4 [Gammaproteobacteria bacterium]
MELVMHVAGKKKPSKVKVSDDIFGQAFNEPLVHQVLVAYMAGGRAGTKAQKTKGEVRGGGVKPWKQKGTGRARAGSIRSPLWRGGGKIFAAQPRDFSKKVNRKMFRGAICSILSELARQERLVCVDDFVVAEPKTKSATALLSGLGLDKALIVTESVNDATRLATRNLPNISIIRTSEMNPYALVGFEKVVMTKAALEKAESWLT